MSRICIVGSADSLTGKGLGEKIDSHDIIVRINQPQISGFEKDVGSRVTHSFIANWQIAGWVIRSNVCAICDNKIENRKTLDKSIVNKDCFERLRNEEGQRAVVLSKSKLFFGLNYDFNCFYRDIIPFIDDSIMIHFIDSFNGMKKWKKRGFSRVPTNGSLVVDYYRKFYGRVNIAGFGHPSNGTQEEFYHYWDTNKEKKLVVLPHEINTDILWLKRLHKKNKIGILELDESNNTV